MKFDALFQDLLEATQKSSKGELPYKSDADGDLVWTRRGGNLEGAPKEVMGGFYCANNQLVSLEGAPKTVGGRTSGNVNILSITPLHFPL